ncbi:MAG: diguanylate cyclase [Methylococcales bacterium]|nr:diguanylate cyclase [Methylococcales bacterium]MDD5755490.1 diguanylate cyclase [Methylococcales bacterium]
MTEKKPLNLKVPVLHLTPSIVNSHTPWRVLVVDDDADVHAVSRLILTKIVFKHRPVELLSAYSAAEAHELLTCEENIAVILLDVVMETEDAGLRLVKTIREELKNNEVRIILRTGQPGQAPEERVIIDYDINDYKAKNELTAQKLFTAVIASLRAYETIVSLNKTRRGLEKILHSSDSLFKIQSMHEFAAGILTQLSLFLECKPQGIICIEENNEVEYPSASSLPNGMKIIAASEEFSCCLKCNLDHSCGHNELAELIQCALIERKNKFNKNYTAFYLDTNDNKATIALVCSENPIDENDHYLLEVFTSKISIALANAIHYQKMITFEKAAVTDFLTGLNNRRQLLRLGVPLLALANRNNLLAVAMIDIDFFKRVNDSHGHDVGDIVLKKVGELMNERFRRMDVVARYGGEEFCILAPSLNIAQAFELFDNFRASVENTEIAISDSETIKITLSIGVSTDLCPSLDDMISAADYLLYRAKHNGRNCVVVK